MHSLAGAISQIQEVWIAGEPVPLLNALQQLSHLLSHAREDQADQCVQPLASFADQSQQCCIKGGTVSLHNAPGLQWILMQCPAEVAADI